MGWSPMIYRFVDGGEVPVRPDPAVVRAVLEPHEVGDPRRTVGEDGTLAFRIRAPDGSEAEITADEYGIGVSRPQAGGVLDIIAELAARLGAVFLDPGRPGVLCRAEDRPHLPPGMREDAVVIDMTGEGLAAALGIR